MKKILLLTILCVNCIFAQKDSFLIHVDEYVNELAENNDFHLSIAIQNGDSLVYSNAFGFANWEHQVPNKTNTKFNIASIGKMFTAVAILKLKEEGKLDLDAVVGQYIPDFPHSGIRDSIQIKELLTHSSGLPLWFSTHFEQNPKFQYKELEDYLPLFEGVKVDYSKKGNNAYSNVGYFVLGFVVEAIDGNNLFTGSLQKHIIDPAGLKDTDIGRVVSPPMRAATGYVRPSDKTDTWKTNHYINMNGGPAGGYLSSVLDLLRFYSALRNQKLLDETHTALMFAPQIETGYGHYGCGIGISENNGHQIIGHLGGFYGIRGELMWYKSSDHTIAILANSDDTDFIDLSYFIKVQLTGTDGQVEAYNATQQLIKAFISSEESLDKWEKHAGVREVQYDEELIQIKAYHFLNSKSYEDARTLFTLNQLLFSDSKSAAFDMERFNSVAN